jgi:hypothetical protein
MREIGRLRTIQIVYTASYKLIDLDYNSIFEEKKQYSLPFGMKPNSFIKNMKFSNIN